MCACACMHLLHHWRQAGGSVVAGCLQQDIKSPVDLRWLSHAHRRCLCDSGESGRVGGGVLPERKALGGWDWDNGCHGYNRERSTCMPRRFSVGGSRPAVGRWGSRSLLLKHTDAEEEGKKKFFSFVPGNVPWASSPVWGSRCPGQKHTSFTHCFSNFIHPIPYWKKNGFDRVLVVKGGKATGEHRNFLLLTNQQRHPLLLQGWD